jgi:hypothetical protein
VRARVEVVVRRPRREVAGQVRAEHVDRVARGRRARVVDADRARGRAMWRRARDVLAPGMMRDVVRGRRPEPRAGREQGIDRARLVDDQVGRSRIFGQAPGGSARPPFGGVLGDGEAGLTRDLAAGPQTGRVEARPPREARVVETRVPGRDVEADRAEVRNEQVEAVRVEASGDVEDVRTRKGLGQGCGDGRRQHERAGQGGQFLDHGGLPGKSFARES